MGSAIYNGQSHLFVQTKKIADVLQGCKTQAIVSVSVYK